MKISRFKVGDPVLVKAVLVRTRDYASDSVLTQIFSSANPPSTRWYQEPCDRKGVVVGVSRRYEGARVDGGGRAGSSLFNEDPEYEPPSFAITKTLMVWLVRFGFTNREQPALDEDVTLLDEPFILPLQADAWKWREEDKSVMREEMATWPRGTNGKWLKKDPNSLL